MLVGTLVGGEYGPGPIGPLLIDVDIDMFEDAGGPEPD